MVEVGQESEKGEGGDLGEEGPKGGGCGHEGAEQGWDLSR